MWIIIVCLVLLAFVLLAPLMEDKSTTAIPSSLWTELRNRKNTILIIVSLLLAAGIGYYYFIATLSLAEIAGKTDSPVVNIGLKLFDFDTGLTRYDIYRLKEEAPYWKKRMESIEAIYDANQKAKESAQLIEEMLNDPAVKKIANKFGAGGIKQMYSIVSSF